MPSSEQPAFLAPLAGSAAVRPSRVLYATTGLGEKYEERVEFTHEVSQSIPVLFSRKYVVLLLKLVRLLDLLWVRHIESRFWMGWEQYEVQQ